MVLFAILLAELTLLYILSNRLSSVLYTVFFALTRSKRVAFSLFTFMFLPGTAIHEFAHLITAEVLRVPTGEISFTPEISSDGEYHEIKMGEVKIAKVDPLRRFLVGTAPVFYGIAVLMLLVWLFQYFWIQITTWQQQVILIGIIGYLMFAVSNNMFSSKKDMEGAVYIVPIILLLIAALYISGFRLSLTGQSLVVFEQVLMGLTKMLGLVIGINFSLLLLNSLFLQGVRKLLR